MVNSKLLGFEATPSSSVDMGVELNRLWNWRLSGIHGSTTGGTLELEAGGYTWECDWRETGGDCRIYMRVRLEGAGGCRLSGIHGRTTGGTLERRAVGYTWEDDSRDEGKKE